jgi:16S rRNA C967 or C1407 C5-methylase (RsmB/RsmF family)
VTEIFDQHFQNIYQDRWHSLKSALQSQVPTDFCFLNPFTNDYQNLSQLLQSKPADRITRNENLLNEYFIDKASVAPILNLEPYLRNSANLSILDMCAAPGGKGLLLSSFIKNDGQMIFNEPSIKRRESLKKVIQNYIPRNIRERVRISGIDGSKFFKQHNTFDVILADVPCSGERHIIENKTEMQKWSVKRTQKLAIQQYAILSAASMACKPGGFILYSTCSISPNENDQVIEKLFDRHSEQFKILMSPEIFQGQENSQWGSQLFPDVAQAGPIYWALIQKLN